MKRYYIKFKDYFNVILGLIIIGLRDKFLFYNIIGNLNYLDLIFYWERLVIKF